MESGGPVSDTAQAVLRCGLMLIAIAASTDALLALVDGTGVATVAEGVVLVGLALLAVLRTDVAARLLRPAGRATALAALFALTGVLDAGLQTNYTQVAPAIVFVAAVVSRPRWLAACVAVSAAGYLAGLLVQGHDLLRGDTPGLLATQAADLALYGGAGLLVVSILRRFLRTAAEQLADVRRGAPSLTPQLAAAVRRPEHLLPRADSVALVAPLTQAERDVLARLAAGRAPKQVAADLGVALTTVRSHVAAAKRKTGARTVSQLVGLFAEGTRAA